jgi:hypothetical protein
MAPSASSSVQSQQTSARIEFPGYAVERPSTCAIGLSRLILAKLIFPLTYLQLTRALFDSFQALAPLDSGLIIVRVLDAAMPEIVERARQCVQANRLEDLVEVAGQGLERPILRPASYLKSVAEPATQMFGHDAYQHVSRPPTACRK